MPSRHAPPRTLPRQYQPHAYHAALVILAAFGKRPEFELLLAVAPKELRLSESTGRPLTYDEHADTCSHAVCRRHAKVIVEMSQGLAKEEAPAGTAEDAGEEEEEREGGRRSTSSGEVGSTAAVTADSGEGHDDNHPKTTTTQGERKSAAAPQGERSSVLVLRSPPPSPPEEQPSSPRDCRMPDAEPASGAAPVAAVMPARQPGPAEQQHPFAAVLPGSAAAGSREAERAAAETGERRWAQEYPPCWPALSPASGGRLSPDGAGGAAPMSGSRSPTEPPCQAGDGVVPLRGGGASDQNPPPSSSSPLQTPSFGHRQGMRLGVLSAAATAITAPADPAARGAAEVRRGGERSAGGASASSRLPVGGRPNQEQRSATKSTYGFAASGDDLGLAGLAAVRHGHGDPAALHATLGNSSSSSTPPEAPVFYGPHRAQQQVGMPTTVGASPQHEAAALAMAMQQEQVSAVGVKVPGGVRAMQAAAPAGGTLTSRLWGMPRQQQQQQPGAQASSSPSGPASAGQFVPSLPGSVPGAPRPCDSLGLSPPLWQWQVGGGGGCGGAASAGEPRPPPTAPPSAAPSDLQLMSNEMLLEDDSTRDVSPPCARQGSPAAAAGPAAGMEAPPLPLPREGRAEKSTGCTGGMTAGEASAAAIALATLSGAPASLSRTPNAAAAEGSCFMGEVGGRERRSYEEEMIALWELIATGDSE